MGGTVSGRQLRALDPISPGPSGISSPASDLDSDPDSGRTPEPPTPSLAVPLLADKMRAGIPLTDEDRWPWLEALAAVIREHLCRRVLPRTR